MRETLQLDKLKCQGSVGTLAEVLAPIKGVNDARVQIGHQSLLIDYDDDARERLEAALAKGGFTIVERSPA